MSGKKITPDEIAEMKRRLEKRREQRQFDADADEVIRMVHGRGKRPAEPGAPKTQAERIAVREYVAEIIPTGRALTFAAASMALARALTANWLFLLVLGMSVFAAAAIAG